MTRKKCLSNRMKWVGKVSFWVRIFCKRKFRGICSVVIIGLVYPHFLFASEKSEIERGLVGGVILPYQIIPFGKGNWAGDGNMWGGLDRSATYSEDIAGVICHADNVTSAAVVNYEIEVSQDFTGGEVCFQVGVRCGPRMARKGIVYWDGMPLLECVPYVTESELPKGKDSVLQVFEKVVSPQKIRLNPGKHVLRFEALPGDAGETGWFQVDAIKLELVPSNSKGKTLRFSTLKISENVDLSASVSRAAEHFKERLKTLGLSKVSDGGIQVNLDLKMVSESELPVPSEKKKEWSEKRPRSRCESYFLKYDETQRNLEIRACGDMGLVYGITDLESRLRKDGEGGYLVFPEWPEEGPFELFEIPAVELRGEYLNIGYNIPGITPHEWDGQRWRDYIDLLMMAKLNRLYFYLWVNGYSMHPGSELSQRELNRKIHEELRGAIRYARERGLEVVYMFCPTFFPEDIWKKNPQIHAEIEYVVHGFPAVCPNAPGAWEMMLENARAEMEWFRDADAIQVWFYDPGGCWCEKNGCKSQQAESLARQVVEFGKLFREYNPTARIEFNIWPIWLWEQRLQIQYRERLSELIRNAFGDKAGEVMAVGAPDNEITQPLLEQRHGFQTSVFLFGTNPERSYVFVVPTLNWLKLVAQAVVEKKFDGAFAHRLEAWTRYPQTFFLSQFLWNPGLSNEDLVRRLGGWIMANDRAGEEIADAFLLLDKLCNEGLDKNLAYRMDELMKRAFVGIEESLRKDWDYLPATTEAISVIAEAQRVTENSTLQVFAERFRQALELSKTFDSVARNTLHIFPQYRTILEKTWWQEPF